MFIRNLKYFFQTTLSFFSLSLVVFISSSTLQLAYGHGVVHDEIDDITCLINNLPTDAELYFQRGQFYAIDEVYDEALDDFLIAEDLAKPGFIPRLHINVARALFLKAVFLPDKDQIPLYQDALQRLDRHIAETGDEEEIDVLVLRGKILGELEEFGAAIKTFQQLGDLIEQPSLDFYTQQSEWFEEQNQIQNALDILDEPQEELGVLPTLQLCAIELSLRNDLTEEALSRVDVLIENATRKESFFSQKGDIQTDAGLTEEANESYQRALSAVAELPEHLRMTPAVGEIAAKSGILVLYTFQEGEGDVVRDLSGIGDPLDLTIRDPSSVTWLGSNGLSVDSPTIIQSSILARKVSRAIRKSNEVTLEAWIRPHNTEQVGPARIVTLSFTSKKLNISLGQVADRYNIRLRTSENIGTEPSVSSPPNTVSLRSLSHIVYTRDQDGMATLYLNGQKIESESIPGNLSIWSTEYFLGLADEVKLQEERFWLGTYRQVAIYERALSESEVSVVFSEGPK